MSLPAVFHLGSRMSESRTTLVATLELTNIKMNLLVIVPVRDLKIEIVTKLARVLGILTAIHTTRLHIAVFPVLMAMIHSVVNHLTTVQTLTELGML